MFPSYVQGTFLPFQTMPQANRTSCNAGDATYEKGHLYFLKGSWISMCLLSLSFRLKAASHTEHLKGFSPGLKKRERNEETGKAQSHRAALVMTEFPLAAVLLYFINSPGSLTLWVNRWILFLLCAALQGSSLSFCSPGQWGS